MKSTYFYTIFIGKLRSDSFAFYTLPQHVCLYHYEDETAVIMILLHLPLSQVIPHEKGTPCRHLFLGKGKCTGKPHLCDINQK